ncbi:MAG: LacI family DNA-binding transcriptional regulator [Sciscionella sp.]
MGAKRPTVYDVAHHLGVSVSTVSRAFSNPQRVNAATRRAVHDAARDLGYLPRPLARVAASGRDQVLTLVVTDIANPYYAPLVKAAQREALARGYTLALADSDESPQVEAGNLRRLLATAGGGILATSRLSDATVRQLAEHRPLVVLNREVSGIPSLVVDTATGMRKVVRHLAALGHERVAYLSGPRNSWANSARWRALHDEAMTLGLHAEFLGPFTPNRHGGREAADLLILTRATAAVAYNDLVAIGTLERLRSAGIRVPADCSLVGCDDIFGTDLTVPGLTTIGGPTEEVGRYAVEVLHARLADFDAAPVHRTFEAHLVIRESTGPRPDVETSGN